MKRGIVAVLLLVNVHAFAACRKGYVPTEVDGVCVAKASVETNPEWIIDEKPPEDKMPSWQREGVYVVDAPKVEYQNIQWMQERDAKENAEKASQGN